MRAQHEKQKLERELAELEYLQQRCCTTWDDERRMLDIRTRLARIDFQEAQRLRG